jgi:hypothetical protein
MAQLDLIASTVGRVASNMHIVKPLRGMVSKTVLQNMLNTTPHRFLTPRLTPLDPIVPRGACMQVQHAVAYGTGTRLYQCDPWVVHPSHGRRDGTASGLSVLLGVGVDLGPPRAPNSSAGDLA